MMGRISMVHRPCLPHCGIISIPFICFPGLRMHHAGIPYPKLLQSKSRTHHHQPLNPDL
uniref:Uncharacterized protein n=1 Tax=Picea glauca TaxID=3330 RepID=A0A124GP64_PICGL|nr:hypothetical protein ABT39_MTgene852 [Picea glauca]